MLATRFCLTQPDCSLRLLSQIALARLLPCIAHLEGFPAYSPTFALLRVLSWHSFPGIALWDSSPGIALLDYSPSLLSGDSSAWSALLDCSLGIARKDSFPGLLPWNALLEWSRALLSWIAILDCSSGPLSWTAFADASLGWLSRIGRDCSSRLLC